MSNNSWIAPVSIIAGIIILGFSYNMYDNNKKAAIETKDEETQIKRNENTHDPYNNEAFGGRKTKRRKYRKNASKKKR